MVVPFAQTRNHTWLSLASRARVSLTTAKPVHAHARLFLEPQVVIFHYHPVGQDLDNRLAA